MASSVQPMAGRGAAQFPSRGRLQLRGNRTMGRSSSSPSRETRGPPADSHCIVRILLIDLQGGVRTLAAAPPRRHGGTGTGSGFSMAGSLPSGCVLPWQDRDGPWPSPSGDVTGHGTCASCLPVPGVVVCRERWPGRVSNAGRQRLVIEVAPGPGFSGFDGPDDSVTGALMIGLARAGFRERSQQADVTAMSCISGGGAISCRC